MTDPVIGSAATDEPTHTMVRSKHGPEYCCQECSTRAKRYVEWPCAARFMASMALLGSIFEDNIRRSLGDG